MSCRVIPKNFIFKIPPEKEMQKQFVPDFSQEEKLYQVTGEHNVLDLMMQKPQYAQQIQSNLGVVQSLSYDTSGLSDSQLIDTCVDRQFDVNEISEFAENDLKKFNDK